MSHKKHQEEDRLAEQVVEAVLEGATLKDLKGISGEQMDKLNSYSDAQANDLDARGATLSVFRLVAEFPANFIKAYIGRRHALRGVYGFMTAMNYAFYRYLRVAKHWERRLQRRLGASVTPPAPDRRDV